MRQLIGILAFIGICLLAFVEMTHGQERSQRDAYRATAPTYQQGRRIDFNFGFTPYAAPYAVPYYRPVQPQYGYVPGYQAIPVVPQQPQFYQPPAIQFRTQRGFQFYIPLQKQPQKNKHYHKRCN